MTMESSVEANLKCSEECQVPSSPTIQPSPLSRLWNGCQSKRRSRPQRSCTLHCKDPPLTPNTATQNSDMALEVNEESYTSNEEEVISRVGECKMPGSPETEMLDTVSSPAPVSDIVATTACSPAKLAKSARGPISKNPASLRAYFKGFEPEASVSYSEALPTVSPSQVCPWFI